MKKILYIAFAVVIFATVSCTNNSMDMPQTPDTSVQALSLKFTCGDMETRATVDGVNNENLIKRIDYFIFPLNEEKKVEDDTEYAYHGVFTPTDDGLAGTYTTDPIQTGALAQIFPNGADSAVVFAVANYVDKYGSNPELTSTSTIPEDITTWKDLHKLEIGPTFFKNGGPGYGLRWPRAMATNEDGLFFVMTADSVAIGLKTTGSNAIEAEIPLARLASKVTVNFSYENCTEVVGGETITWVPMAGEGSETRVYLSNAIEHATLGGPLTRPLVGDSDAGTTKPAGNGSRDIFEYSYDYMKNFDSGEIPYYYTYPISVEEGDDNQPFLKLVLLWYGYKGYGTAEQRKYKQKEVYYKIVLPRETITKPNCIYEYSVKVNIAGSDKEVKIIGDEYIVKNWTSKTPVSSNVATGRYISLDIPKDEYDMYVDEIDISFVSSGTVIPIINEIYQWNNSGNTPTKDYFMQNGQVTTNQTLLDSKDLTADQVKSWVTIPAETSYLKINHAMCNDITVDPISKFDAAPYVYSITLHLEAAGDDDSFDRTITVTQYPAMYITAETNSAYPNNSYGYVYVNGQQNTTTGSWYRVSGLSGTNSNPNMFVITSTILSDSSMALGDPRTTAVQNGYNSNDNSWSPTDNSMYQTGTRQLMYYYPTDKSDAAKKLVSPKFRIASSYGKTQPVSRQEAFQRCASYQEDGYPAGRWRIPTSSEVKYVVNLSANGFMDVLFGNPRTQNESTNYWTASGYITVNNYTETVTPHDGDTTGNVYVRCVYDDWYWKDKAPDKSDSIWGDKLR